VTRLECAGQSFETGVQETQGQLTVTVDGKFFAVDVEAVALGSFVLRNGDAVRTFHCVREGDTIHLFWDAVVYRLVEPAEGRRASQRQQSGGLEAPMPGKVIKLSVAVGDRVKKGQEILVVEAMKMENAIRAPHDGRIARLAAKVGDMVSPGTVLVELE
jgi:biotin carboxyl carrier protein